MIVDGNITIYEGEKRSYNAKTPIEVLKFMRELYKPTIQTYIIDNNNLLIRNTKTDNDFDIYLSKNEEKFNIEIYKYSDREIMIHQVEDFYISLLELFAESSRLGLSNICKNEYAEIIMVDNVNNRGGFNSLEIIPKNNSKYKFIEIDNSEYFEPFSNFFESIKTVAKELPKDEAIIETNNETLQTIDFVSGSYGSYHNSVEGTNAITEMLLVKKL